MFEIFLTQSARRDLNELPRVISKRIYNKLIEFREDPLISRGIKKLVGKPYYRIRVGDYRIIFDINRSENKIYVLKIAHRKNIYKQ